MTTLNLQVGASSDDAHEIGGTMGLTNLRVALISDTRKGGFRFTNVTVPQGAVITSAAMQIKAGDTSNDDPDDIIYGEDADNASTFTSTTNDITDRTKTTASVAWSTTGIGTSFVSTPSLVSVVQEIVDRSGWSSGNAMVFIWEHQSAAALRVVAYDDVTANAAKLDVDYATDWLTHGVARPVERARPVRQLRI